MRWRLRLLASSQPGLPLRARLEPSFAANRGGRRRSKRHARKPTGDRQAGSSGCFGQARLFRMPPSSGDDNALRSDLTFPGEVLANDIDVIEAALIDGQDGRVADAAWLETAELRSLQSECGVDGRSCDHIAQRHAETKKLRHGGDLVECRPVYAER